MGQIHHNADDEGRGKRFCLCALYNLLFQVSNPQPICFASGFFNFLFFFSILEPDL